MKILMVEPGKMPCETEINSGLEALQKAVGGHIQAVYPYEDPVAIVCNEEGKIMGMPLNRALSDEDGNIYDIIAGNFLIVGLGEESFSDLSPDLMEKYSEQFKHPEKFVRIAGKYLAVKQPLPEESEKPPQSMVIANGISLIYSILFNRLCERADDVYGGRLPVHVRCLIDEAANIGQIPNLERLMATIRSREISACLVLQAQSQLKALYKDNMDTIIGNCDASLFLGGKEETTLKSWSSLLGKETIDLYNTSVTKGTQESHGQNFQKLGKDLMSVDELAVMDGGKCLLQIRGVRPFLSRKYDITKHPRYKYLSDFDKKNTFDIEKFLSTRFPVRPGGLYRNYEITPEDLKAQME